MSCLQEWNINLFVTRYIYNVAIMLKHIKIRERNECFLTLHFQPVDAGAEAATYITPHDINSFPVKRENGEYLFDCLPKFNLSTAKIMRAIF